jgi:hypothetical protein
VQYRLLVFAPGLSHSHQEAGARAFVHSGSANTFSLPSLSYQTRHNLIAGFKRWDTQDQ